MGLKLKEHEFQKLIDLVKSFPEVTLIESGFKEDNMFSTHIITAGEWPKTLRVAIAEQFPQLVGNCHTYPVYPDQAAADAAMEEQRANHEPVTAPLFLHHGPLRSEDTG